MKAPLPAVVIIIKSFVRAENKRAGEPRTCISSYAEQAPGSQASDSGARGVVGKKRRLYR
jgi:hypothetical protein